MNQIVISSETITMSSLEISELTGKQHAHVMRDIRTMLAELHGEKGVSNFGDTHANKQNGQTYPIFNLPKRETLILVSGYNLKMRAAIIDRWQQLEAEAAQPAFDPASLSRMQLIQLALDAESERLVLEKKVDELAPKAAALDAIAEADGAMNPTVAAKVLQINPKQLFNWLRSNEWIYRRPGGSGNVAYQDKIKSGYLTHKVTTIHRNDGTEKVVEQVLVTGKGLTKISQSLGVQ